MTKEKIREGWRRATKKYKQKHLQKVMKLDRESHQRSADANPCSVLLKNAKVRAKKIGVPFNLKLEDIHIPRFCPVLGIRLIRRAGRTIKKDPQRIYSRSNNSPSLDRINSKKGYTKKNVAVISWRANRLKNNATLKEIEAIAAYMRRKGKR